MLASSNVLPLRDRNGLSSDDGLPAMMDLEAVLRMVKLLTDGMTGDFRRDVALKRVLEHTRPVEVCAMLEGMSDELIAADVVDEAIGNPAVSAVMVDAVLAWADDRLVKVNPLLEAAVVRGDEQVFAVVYERLHKRVTNWVGVFEAAIKNQQEAIFSYLVVHAALLTPEEAEELADSAENDHWAALVAEL